MTPLITISHIAMTSSSFLILAASFERFCVTCWSSKVKWVHKWRRFIASGAIMFGFITKFTLAREFEVFKLKKNCKIYLSNINYYRLFLIKTALELCWNIALSFLH